MGPLVAASPRGGEAGTRGGDPAVSAAWGAYRRLLRLPRSPAFPPLRSAELPDRQEFQHPVLHVAERVVILVEDALGFREVEVLLAAGAPGQLENGLEVGADDLGLHRLPRDPAESAEFAVHLAARVGRQVERGELGPQFLEIVGLVVLAQFPADRLQLLAKEHLALTLAELLLDLGLDVLLRVHEADLALDVHEDTPEPVLDRQRLEERLALHRGDVEVARHEVGEPSGVVHAGEHLLNDLLRQPRLLAQLGGARAGLAVERHERGILEADRRQFLGVADHGLEVAVLVDDVHGDAAPLAVQEKLHAGQAALQLPDLGDGTDGVEVVRADLFDVFPLGNGEYQFFRSGQRRLDGAKRPGPTGADGSRDAGEEHDIAEGENGDRQAFSHFEYPQALFRGRKWQGSIAVGSSSAPPMPPGTDRISLPLASVWAHRMQYGTRNLRGHRPSAIPTGSLCPGRRSWEFRQRVALSSGGRQIGVFLMNPHFACNARGPEPR